jgi:hypothetical protein
MTIAMQHLGKQTSTIERLFSVWSTLWLYNESCEPCVEAGSNTSTVTLRVVGGDEKGSLKSQIVKYGRKSHGTNTWLARASSIYKRQTRPLVREGAPQKQDPNCQTVINI